MCESLIPKRSVSGSGLYKTCSKTESYLMFSEPQRRTICPEIKLISLIPKRSVSGSGLYKTFSETESYLKLSEQQRGTIFILQSIDIAYPEAQRFGIRFTQDVL